MISPVATLMTRMSYPWMSRTGSLHRARSGDASAKRMSDVIVTGPLSGGESDVVGASTVMVADAIASSATSSSPHAAPTTASPRNFAARHTGCSSTPVTACVWCYDPLELTERAPGRKHYDVTIVGYPTGRVALIGS